MCSGDFRLLTCIASLVVCRCFEWGDAGVTFQVSAKLRMTLFMIEVSMEATIIHKLVHVALS